MKTIEERGYEKFPILMVPLSGEGLVDTNKEYRELYISAAKEQKAIDDARYETYLKEMNEEISRSLASQREVIIEKAWRIYNMPVCGSWTKDSFTKAMKGE